MLILDSQGIEKHRRLNGQEAASAFTRQALLDEYARDSATVAPDGQVDVTNSLAQLGRPLRVQTIIVRLQKLSPYFHFEISNADSTKMGIYVIREGEKKFICGMENGWMPEFSVRHFQEKKYPDPDRTGHWMTKKVFTKETRGWRTVLTRLIKEKMFSLSQAESAFGILKGRDSRNWQAITT